MRPSIPIKASRPIRDRPAACAYAALALSLLVLLPAAPAGASEAGNLFGGAAQSSTQAAKPASGVGRVATQAAKQPSAGAKLSTQVPKVTPQVTSTPNVATSTTAASTQESSSKTSTTMITALVAGILVLGGIAFVIVRDARSVAPVVDGLVTGGTRNPEGRLRKRRAQAKAARRQRKRHRKR